MKIKIAINSNKNFSATTYPVVVESLIDSGISKKDIYFFEGGYDEYSVIESDINRYQCNHNSIDFTALISIVDLGLKSDFWFMIHDTTKVGKNFFNYAKNFNKSDKGKKVYCGPSMNMGLYSHDLIVSNRDLLNKFKNYSNSKESLQKYKSLNVEYEDWLLNLCESPCYCNNPPETSGPVDYYNNGVMRIIEKYSEIDIYKMKANWHLKNEYELSL